MRNVSFLSGGLVKIGLILICLVVVQSAHGLNPQKPFEQYRYEKWEDYKDGLPHASIVSLMQAQDGYIWIGTQEGVVRFDGRRFEQLEFPNVEGGVYWANILYQKRDGTVLIGTYAGGLINWRNEGNYKVLRGVLEDQRIVDICEDKSQRTYILTVDGGLYVDDVNGIKKIFYHSSSEAQVAQSLLCVDDGPVLIGTQRGLLWASKDSNHTNLYDQKELREAIIYRMVREDDGTLWLATSSGLWRRVQNSFQQVPGTSELSIQDILRDNDGNLWLATQNMGLAVLKKGGLEVYNTRHNLPSLDVNRLLMDAEKNLWLGFNSAGLMKVSDSMVSTIVTTPPEMETAIYPVSQSVDGAMWFGSKSGLSYLLGNEFNYIDVDAGLPAPFVLTMAPSRRGGMWVGTLGGGVALVKNGVVSRVINEGDGLSSDRILSLYEDPDGDLWVGTVAHGLNLVTSDGIKQFSAQEGLNNPRIASIVRTESGRVYFATDAGIQVYEDGKFSDMTQLKGHPAGRCLGLYLDSENRLWITTYGRGLYMYNNESFFSLKNHHGLPSNVLLTVLEDNNENLWMSTSKGLIKIAKKDALAVMQGHKPKLDAEFFGESDGMTNPEGNRGGKSPSWKSSDGSLWFATMGGAVKVAGLEKVFNTVPPPVVLREIVADSKDVTKQKVLKAGTTRLEFHFSGLSYVSPQEVRFRYKLEGFDADWVESDKKDFAYYTSLAPGEYTFRVIACNNDGVWNKTGASHTFVIDAFFYQTLLFRILGIVAILTIVVMLTWAAQWYKNKKDKESSTVAWQQTKSALDEKVSDLRGVAQGVAEVAHSVEDYMNRLSSSSSQLAASVTQSVATVSELERAGTSVEEHAARIVASSKKTEGMSVKGVAAASESTNIMQTIHVDSKAIALKSSKLTDEINELQLVVLMVKAISDRSKVLAINASIEASKAGELGVGFGTVAQKMKNLAIESASATSEIALALARVLATTEDISATAVRGTKITKQGTATIDQNGEIVGKLSTEITQNAGLAKNIFTSINQQLTDLKSIAVAISQIDQTAGENMSISSQTKSGAAGLRESIEKLNSMIVDWEAPRFIK